MRTSLFAAGAAVAMVCAATAQAQGIQINPVGATPTRLGAAPNFNGQVVVDIKSAGDSAKYGSVGIVDFSPGARTAWHVHPIGQLLVVTDGKGWVQEEGAPRREINAGDVVWIEAGIKHWHGATQANGMRHLAVAYLSDGKSTDWNEQVSDEHYAAP